MDYDAQKDKDDEMLMNGYQKWRKSECAIMRMSYSFFVRPS